MEYQAPIPLSIHTGRLLLRTLTEADAAMVKDFGAGEFAADSDALAWIRWVNSEPDGHKPLFMFYIWLPQTSQAIGRVYIHSKPELDGEVEVGYGITEEFRCQGYATEAARAIVQFAFERAGLEKLSAIVARENIASRRVIEKLSFQSRGVRTVFDNGQDRVFDYFKLYREGK